MDIDQEAALLAEKEEWCRQTAAAIRDFRGLDYPTALAAARWASMWLDDFKIRLQESPPRDADDIRAAMKAAEASSLLRADGIPRYPSGVPAIRVIIAVRDAFVSAFDEQERANVRQIIHANGSEA